MRDLWRWTVFAVVLVVIASSTTTAHAQADPRSERERVRRGRAAAAADLDVLRSENAQVEAALAALDEQVAAESAALADAERAVGQAQAALAAAKQAEVEAEERLDASKAALRDMAVAQFIAGGVRTVSIGAELGVAERVRRDALADFAVGTIDDAGDALGAALEDLGVARERAALASADAAERRDAAAARAAVVTEARNVQANFAARLDERINSRLAEAASLAAVDERLSAEIQRQQLALASRASRGASSSSVTRVSGNVRLRTVRGITVHEDIADEVGALVDAAAADGIRLGGGGYRNPEDQQRLREAHCPDPERSPARDCRPPTARPGYSQHERGLAIDFTADGSLIRSRSSAGFRWLNANAGRYGLRNLPEEPWHWSTTGS